MVLSVIVLAIIGFFVYQQFFTHAGTKENINFSRVGNLVINNPGLEEGVWHLVYETPGSPANAVKLVFDGKSNCKNQTGSCLDLIVGERVSVKGIENGGGVLVKEMEFLDNVDVNEPTGVDWDMAMGFLSECRADKISVNNKKEVYLTLDDGSRLFTIESNGSFISDEVKKAEKKCGHIPFIVE